MWRTELARVTLSLCFRWIGWRERGREKKESPEHNSVIQCTIWLTERQLRTIIQCTMKMFTYTFYAYACLLYTWPLPSCVYARMANDVNLAISFCFLCKLRRKFAREILTSPSSLAQFDIMSVACATVQTVCVCVCRNEERNIDGLSGHYWSSRLNRNSITSTFKKHL
jgi:hypothetical protein